MNAMKKFIATSLLVLLVLPFTTAMAAKTPHEVVPQQIEFSQAELEQMLAPIALYPDTLLSHILIAATYPLEIIQAERWSAQYPDLTADEINTAIEDKDWDPSVKALVPFPRVLKRMSDDIEWTQNLGDAFLQDEKKVLAGIQTLRLDAEKAGNLENLEHLNVTREEKTIVIEPARPEVVYVPYYDPRVVYGSWRWTHYPPVYWGYPGYVSYPSHYYPNSLFYWGPRIHISLGYGFSAFNWHNHHIVVLPYNHHHRYYSRRQIVHHNSHSRWQHNPRHRRGASYRTTAVANRFNSNRDSRSNVRVSREQRNSVSNNRSQVRSPSRQQRISNEIRENTRVREPVLVNGRLKNQKKPRYSRGSDSRITPIDPSVGRARKDVVKNNPRTRTTAPSTSVRQSKPRKNYSSDVQRPVKKRQYSQPKAEYQQPKARQYVAPKAAPKQESNYKSQKSQTSSRSSNKSSSRSSQKSSKRSGSSRGSKRN